MPCILGFNSFSMKCIRDSICAEMFFILSCKTRAFLFEADSAAILIIHRNNTMSF